MSQPPPQYPPGSSFPGWSPPPGAGGPPPGSGPPQGWGPGGPPGGQPPQSRSPLIAVLLIAAVVLVGGGLFLVTQSGGDDEPSEEEQAYIDAFAEMDTGQTGYSDQETRCLAEIVVDVIGVDTLREAATPEEIRENAGGGGISDFGIRLDEGQATSVYERASDCIDFRELVFDRLRQQGYTDEQVDCVDRNLSEDLLRDSVIAGFTEDEQAAQQASQAINEATASCQAGQG